MARVALEGKNLGRLNRWIAPGAANARGGSARAFAAGGLLTLSDDVTAFTDVKGDVDRTPFTASLRLDKTPARKLKVSLAGDSFDLTSLESGQTGADALSSESVKAAWQAGLALLTPVLGGMIPRTSIQPILMSLPKAFERASLKQRTSRFS